MLGILLTTIIWGGGFVITKNAVGRITPIYMMAARFTIACAALPVFYFRKIKLITRADMLPGAALGFWLAAGFITQTYGIKYTTASNSAFITSFYVVAVPFLNLLFNRARLRAIHLAAAAMAFAGVLLLSVDGAFRINSGDALTFVCSFCYAAHIVLLGRYAKKRDVAALTMLQMLFAAAFCWICAPVFEGAPGLSILFGGSGLRLISEILYLALLSTMLGFLLQTSAQKNLPTATASVLLTLECVFGSAFSIIFLRDPVGPRNISGFALMFAAVLVSVLKSPSD